LKSIDGLLESLTDRGLPDRSANQSIWSIGQSANRPIGQSANRPIKNHQSRNAFQSGIDFGN